MPMTEIRVLVISFSIDCSIFNGFYFPSAAAGRSIKVLNAWVEDTCETIWGACSDNAVRVWDGSEGTSFIEDIQYEIIEILRKENI